MFPLEMAVNNVHFKLDRNAAASIDQYLEYRRIVGDDDCGRLFSAEEYEEYKRKTIPVRMKNRLYVSWTAPNGMDCKMIGPETTCFCNHRYKQHKTDYEILPQTRPIPVPCRVSGCKCKSYTYVPKNGTQLIRCQCKHFSDDHSELAPHKCFKGCGCNKFVSSFTCGCGQPTYAHETIIETKEERLARGHSVGQDVPYAAMGGITGFSSLMDGYLRLDDSGIGPLPHHALERPIGPSDHPLLRTHAGISGLGLEEGKGVVSDGKVVQYATEEGDMAYFEKRYQERLKAEKEQARLQSSHQAKRLTEGSFGRTGPGKLPLGTKPIGPPRIHGTQARKQNKKVLPPETKERTIKKGASSN